MTERPSLDVEDEDIRELIKTTHKPYDGWHNQTADDILINQYVHVICTRDEQDWPCASVINYRLYQETAHAEWMAELDKFTEDKPKRKVKRRYSSPFFNYERDTND